MDDVRTFTGTLILDLRLTAAQSLKDRRAPLRALVQKLRNTHLAVAQVGPSDLVQRVFLAVGAVSGTEHLAAQLLDEAERIVYAGEFEVCEIRRAITCESFPSSR